MLFTLQVTDSSTPPNQYTAQFLLNVGFGASQSQQLASIRYRKLDGSGDPMYGHGSADFATDIDAVAQAILTKLKLFQGEWWENLNEGTPIFQSILGVGGAGKRPDVIALILKQRIMQTPFVTGVTNISTSYNNATRAFSFSCVVQTQFGPLTITNAPGSLGN